MKLYQKVRRIDTGQAGYYVGIDSAGRELFRRDGRTMSLQPGKMIVFRRRQMEAANGGQVVIDVPIENSLAVQKQFAEHSTVASVPAAWFLRLIQDAAAYRVLAACGRMECMAAEVPLDGEHQEVVEFWNGLKEFYNEL